MFIWPHFIIEISFSTLFEAFFIIIMQYLDLTRFYKIEHLSKTVTPSPFIGQISIFLCLKISKENEQQLLFYAKFHLEILLLHKIFDWKVPFFHFLLSKPKHKRSFFSEGQIIRISLNLILNAPWVPLSRNTILVQVSILRVRPLQSRTVYHEQAVSNVFIQQIVDVL